MQRVSIVMCGILFAVVSSGCAGGSANPVEPSAAAAVVGEQARGGGGGGGKPPKGDGTLALVIANDVNGDGLPNRGDSVTFRITTSVTTEPYVELICRQDGRLVFGKVAGYFDSYPWPWSKVMLLSSDLWVGGAASCTAELYYNNRLTRTSLTTISFTAYQ